MTMTGDVHRMTQSTNGDERAPSWSGLNDVDHPTLHYSVQRREMAMRESDDNYVYEPMLRRLLTSSTPYIE
jgi:hypothetical protein